MKYVKFYVGVGCVGGDKYEVMEFPDDATDSDIDEAYDEWRECHIDSAWRECNKDGNTI